MSLLETVLREVAVATYAVVFAILAIRALVDFRRRGDRSSLWFSTAFTALALTVAGSIVLEIVSGDEPPTWATRVLVVVLTAYSPSLLSFAHVFGGISQLERYLAFGWFGTLALWAGTVLEFPPPGSTGSTPFQVFAAAFVGGWILVSLRVIATLWFGSGRRPGIVRGRMRLLAIGVALLDVALLIQALDVDQQLRLLVAAISAIAALSLLLGFTPPQWLRILLRQREQQALRAAVAQIARAVTEQDVLEVLLPATRDVLGVDRIALVPYGHGDVLSTGFDEPTLERIRTGTRGLQLDDGVDSALVDGLLVTRGAASWIVMERITSGAFIGTDELEVLASMDAIVRMSLARIRDSAAIREHEQQLQTAVDIAELGKWYWQLEDEAVWWSPRMYEIFAVDPSDPITYERYRELLAPEERDRLAAIVDEAIERREPYELTHRIVRADGSEAWVHSRARVVLGEDDQPRRVTGVTIDVTERTRYEQELRDAVAVEREAAERLRALDELKSNILSAVSHELRTPLTSVHGFAILLQDRMDELEPERRQEIVGHLVVEAERLAQLFSDLLDIDRLRRGVIEAQRTPASIREIVVGVVDRREQRERILLDVVDDEFEVDAPKLERIVENLVVNAEKYAPDSQVRIIARIDDEGLELRVDDDGPGVAEHLRERIFEPFNRGDADLGHAPGTGIGLSLVRQFARLHDGRAWVEPTSTGGASFVVRIPAVPAAA